MQTRKRAKTITFGKKKKDETEEVETPVVEPPEPVAETPETTEEKAETVERRTLSDKPQSSELSATLPSTPEEEASPKGEEKPEASEATEATVTPANEFITDDEPVATAEPEETKEEEKAVEPAAVEPQLETSLSPETPAVSETTPEAVATPAETPVETSAFTIQNDEKAPAPEVSGDNGKKRFGLYFFLVAFLAFILGLGAMAAVTYGWVNVPFLKDLKVPSSVKMPAIPGVNNPTPTAAPTVVPTVAPTDKAVDMKAYTISVLNGSGVVGKAAEVKTSLTTAGFKVGTTGNADKSDYTKTQIAAKKSVDKAYLAKLTEELKKSFDVAEVSTAPDSDSSDVTVTIGSATATK